MNQIRNSHIVEGTAAAGFQDGSLWAEAKRKGDAAVKTLIDRGLEGTTVTVVRIGSETSKRTYVKYEIDKSIERRNGLLRIYIHNVKDEFGLPSVKGKNPFDNLYWSRNGQQVYLSSYYLTYDWLVDRGYENFADWVERAAKQSGV